EVETVGGRPPRTVQRSSLCRVIEARAEETLKLIQGKIHDGAFAGKLGSGVVLTGGASELAGFVEMGDFIFDMPARLGVPNRTGGLMDVVKSASFSTAVGLLLYGYEIEKPKIVGSEQEDMMVDKLTDIGRRLK